jgi:multiple antibiotic resistance protein
MPGALADLLQFSFVALTSVFFLVDPIAAIPTFPRHDRGAGSGSAPPHGQTRGLDLSGGAHRLRRGGQADLPALWDHAAGLQNRRGRDPAADRARHAARAPLSDQRDARRSRGRGRKEDVGIIPLGIPMLAGPGAISTVMVLIGGSPAGGTRFPCFWPLLPFPWCRTGSWPGQTACGTIWERPEFESSPA